MKFRTILALLILAVSVPGCAAYQQYEAGKPETIQQTEAMLRDAGFHPIPITTTAQLSIARDLPAFEMQHYDAEHGTVFWYYDPRICRCIYAGDEGDFERYDIAMRQQHDIDAYVAQSEEVDAANLYLLNGTMFPPPLFLLVPGPVYGGIASAGGGVPGGRGGRGGKGGGGGGIGGSKGGGGAHFGGGGWFGGGHSFGGGFGGGHGFGSSFGHGGGHGK